MITAGDFLAGGGGVTEALRRISGVDVKFVLNHDKIAIRTNMYNHRGVKHYWADLYKQDEHEVEPVDFIWASIECTQHSRANGGREKKIGSYTLGWELVRYIKHIQPFVIGIENVPEFKDWAPTTPDGSPIKLYKGNEFENWKKAICSEGYEYHELICNAADYGIPTRRVRYFAFFTRIELGMQVNWPEPTHSKTGGNGKSKWVACRNYIDLSKEGESIFGRKFNENIRKGKRNPLSPNTLKRIAGGIKKYAPDLHFILQYYGNGLNANGLEAPLNTITVKDRHILISVEKAQFVADHCYTDNFNNPHEPLNPILTRETKQLITVNNKFFSKYYSGDNHFAFSLDDPFHTIKTVDSIAMIDTKCQFLSDYYGRDNTAHPLDGPANTITTENSKNLVTAQFISPQYNSRNNPGANKSDINEPLWALSTKEKFQFITAYYSASGNQESQNQSIENPLNAITTGPNKQAIITALQSGELDFDIKMRFLDPEELSKISTFPDQYFTAKPLKLTRKEQVKLIGNAVPPDWARIIIQPIISELQQILSAKREAV